MRSYPHLTFSSSSPVCSPICFSPLQEDPSSSSPLVFLRFVSGERGGVEEASVDNEERQGISGEEEIEEEEEEEEEEEKEEEEEEEEENFFQEAEDLNLQISFNKFSLLLLLL